MKKQYINPRTVTVKVDTQNIMFSASDGGGNKGNFSTTNGQLSRERGGWDDED